MALELALKESEAEASARLCREDVIHGRDGVTERSDSSTDASDEDEELELAKAASLLEATALRQRKERTAIGLELGRLVELEEDCGGAEAAEGAFLSALDTEQGLVFLQRYPELGFVVEQARVGVMGWQTKLHKAARIMVQEVRDGKGATVQHVSLQEEENLWPGTREAVRASIVNVSASRGHFSGLPNLGNTCFANSVAQLIARALDVLNVSATSILEEAARLRALQEAARLLELEEAAHLAAPQSVSQPAVQLGQAGKLPHGVGGSWSERLRDRRGRSSEEEGEGKRKRREKKKAPPAPVTQALFRLVECLQRPTLLREAASSKEVVQRTKAFKSSIGAEFREYKGSEQHDPHELMTRLLTGIAEDKTTPLVGEVYWVGFM
jgi:hypothetical protein